jgi:hypothetical protein
MDIARLTKTGKAFASSGPSWHLVSRSRLGSAERQPPFDPHQTVVVFRRTQISPDGEFSIPYIWTEQSRAPVISLNFRPAISGSPENRATPGVFAKLAATNTPDEGLVAYGFCGYQPEIPSSYRASA